jgi:hypothetical protein
VRGDEIEPGIGCQRRPSNCSEEWQARRSAYERKQRQNERQGLEQVEAGPGDIPVVGDMLAWKGRAQVAGPGEERQCDAAEHEDEPVPRTAEVVEVENGDPAVGRQLLFHTRILQNRLGPPGPG